MTYTGSSVRVDIDVMPNATITVFDHYHYPYIMGVMFFLTKLNLVITLIYQFYDGQSFDAVISSLNSHDG